VGPVTAPAIIGKPICGAGDRTGQCRRVGSPALQMLTAPAILRRAGSRLRTLRRGKHPPYRIVSQL